MSAWRNIVGPQEDAPPIGNRLSHQSRHEIGALAVGQEVKIQTNGRCVFVDNYNPFGAGTVHVSVDGGANYCQLLRGGFMRTGRFTELRVVNRSPVPLTNLALVTSENKAYRLWEEF